MKIDPHKLAESQGPKRGAQNIQKSPAAEPADKSPKINNATPADKVDISSKSKQIADIMAAVNQLPEVRDTKVQEIKKSVEAGTYNIDPAKVAANILKEI
jgi:flagellar biosynthesis anti-sigma factor FlgM